VVLLVTVLLVTVLPLEERLDEWEDEERLPDVHDDVLEGPTDDEPSPMSPARVLPPQAASAARVAHAAMARLIVMVSCPTRSFCTGDAELNLARDAGFLAPSCATPVMRISEQEASLARRA
jgi:hypothetical protein